MTIPPDVIEMMAYAMCGEKCSCCETGFISTFERCVARKNKAQAAISALADSGYVVVPKGPTKEMEGAGIKAYADYEPGRDVTVGGLVWRIYRAMVTLPTKDTEHDG